MRVRVFTLPWVEPGRFDDGELVDFLAERLVISIQDHFFVHENTPRMVLVVSYRDVVEPVGRPGSEGRRRPSVRPEEVAALTGEEAARYDNLRRWRNTTAKRTGKPAYLVLTNRQALAIARNPPSTLVALGEFDGIGPARVAEFGAELLGVLSVEGATAAADPVEAATETDGAER